MILFFKSFPLLSKIANLKSLGKCLKDWNDIFFHQILLGIVGNPSKPIFAQQFQLAQFLQEFKVESRKTHHGQIDLNKMLNTAKGTHQTSKWTPLGPQITEN